MSIEKIFNLFKQRYNYMFRQNKQMGLYALISEDEHIPLEDTVTINGQLCVHNDTREKHFRLKHSSKYSLYNKEIFNFKECSDEMDENENHTSPFKNHTFVHEVCIIDKSDSRDRVIAKINLNNGAAAISSRVASATGLANLQMLLSSWTTEFINQRYTLQKEK